MKLILAQNGSIYNADRIISVYPVIKEGVVEPVRFVRNSYGDECVVSRNYITYYAVVDGLDLDVKLWHGVAGTDKANEYCRKIVRFLSDYEPKLMVLDLEDEK